MGIIISYHLYISWFMSIKYRGSLEKDKQPQYNDHTQNLINLKILYAQISS